jgi:hypothetical protein
LVIVKIPYINNTDRERIIAENQEKYLIEEQNITEGNFLIFSDEIPIYEAITLNTKIAQLEQLVADLASLQLGV